MSSELEKGILKPIQVTERREFSEEEKKKYAKIFEKILKESGVLKEDESIADIEKQMKENQ